MSLSPGTRLGAFEVVSSLGAGGMGEVYRARDSKLNRHVAIKVLPDAYAGDAERVARFHREAQAVAALNHPNIAAIYELAEAPLQPGGASETALAPIKFLVLELIEGDTLADRLRRGPVPVDEALLIIKQILEALEAAHEKGICHRDLKPANVKLTADGAVKVLDFGLAKFLQGTSAAGNVTNSPTLSVAGTVPGLILGTAAYMSPEQAKGYEADQRSDLFSVGCILYELLTGRKAFEGETASEILAGVLKSEVDFTVLPARLNPRLVEVLRRCLEKNPKKRWHAAADVRVEIEAVMGRATVEEPRAAEAVAPRPLWKRAVPVAVGVTLGALVAGSAAWTLKPEPRRSIARFAFTLPEGQQFTNTGRQIVAISPDGSNLLYVANFGLYLRPMSALESRLLAGSQVTGGGVINPVFSPDGQAVAFWAQADSTVKRLSVSGGAPVTICQATNPLGMSWDETGIVFGQDGKGILRVSPNGGVPEVIAAVDSGQTASVPQMLPGGRAVLFSIKSAAETWTKSQVVVQRLGAERKVLVEGGADGRYLPTGHLVYALSGVLLAVPFDLDTLTVTGGPVPIVEGVRRASAAAGSGAAQFSFSSSGTLAFVPGPAQVDSADSGNLDLALFDRKGTPTPLKLPPGRYSAPRVSPDGKFVAFERAGANAVDVWTYELSGGRAPQQLTFGGRNVAPVWSRDGAWVVFQSDREGDLALFRQRADGSGTAERLTKPEAGAAHIPQSFSPGDAHLFFSTQSKDQAWTLWTMTVKDRQVSPFGNVRSTELVEAAFSPDGRWVAYQERVPGASARQVFLQPFPATGAKYLVRDGGSPYWSPKGDQLILNVGPGRSVIVPVTTAPRVAFGQPVDFSRGGRTENNPGTNRRNADSMPDGEHIIGLAVQGQPADAALAQQIVVVLNWFDEVRQRVPRD